MPRKPMCELSKSQWYKRMNEIFGRGNIHFDGDNIVPEEVQQLHNQRHAQNFLIEAENANNEEGILFGQINADPINGVNEEREEPYEYNVEEDEDSEYESEESEEENNDFNENRNYRYDDIEHNQLLYHNAPLTVVQSMLLIFSLVVNHNVNMSCLADIIEIINLHCIARGLKKNSVFKFKNFFSLRKSKPKRHYYCTTCQRELQSENDICQPCPRQQNSFFIQVPLISHLKEMFLRNNFFDNLQGRFQRPVNENIISDIYDGSVYKYWMNNGFLSDLHNFSFSWYTDGVPVFKSSQISMWPVYLTINELPFSERKKKENTLLLGLWFGKTKPFANLFLQKLSSELYEIADGIQIKKPGEENPIKVRGILLTGVADLLAKNEFMNIIQFNGNYGCPTCCIKGEGFDLEPRGSVHIYRYTNNIINRTMDDCIRWANNASPENPIMGVKGPTTLSLLMPDFIEGMAIDRMHCVDGGVIKKLLLLMFSNEYSAEPFSLYGVINVINARLLSIKPPKFVHRMPRSVQELIHWKASELKMWCFYYSIPVLEGILRQDYFNHYLLLITAITILNSQQMTMQMIDMAEDFLNKFVKDFEELYGLRFCSINIHQLLHLPDCVRRLGPLWTSNCFEYENLNGLFLKLIHGTGHIDTQIATSHERCINMIRLTERLPPGAIRDFCLKKKKQVKIIEQISESCYSVGVYKIFNPPNYLMNILHNTHIPYYRTIRKYFRILKRGKLYVSKEYRENLSTDSYAIQYIDDNHHLQLSLILHFVKISNCQCIQNLCFCNGHHYAVTKKIITDEYLQTHGDRYAYNSASFLHKCHLDESIELVPINNIITVCVYMDIDGQLYIGIPTNLYELE